MMMKCIATKAFLIEIFTSRHVRGLHTMIPKCRLYAGRFTAMLTSLFDTENFRKCRWRILMSVAFIYFIIYQMPTYFSINRRLFVFGFSAKFGMAANGVMLFVTLAHGAAFHADAWYFKEIDERAEDCRRGVV